MNQEIADKIINTKDFATIPAVSSRILRFLQRDDVNFKDLATIIETDPSLTIKMIAVANSAMYSPKIPATSLVQAVQTLGMNKVSNIVLGISIFTKFMISSNEELESILDKFWWHSACTATLAKSIAKRLKINFNEIEFICGLFHDIGKLAMIQYDYGTYQKVMELVEFGQADTKEIEEKYFGIDHRDLTVEVLKSWKMPENIVSILSLNLASEATKEEKTVMSLIKISNIFCELWGAGFFSGVKEIEIENNEAWLFLKENYADKIDNFDLETFTIDLENEFNNSSDFLKLIKN